MRIEWTPNARRNLRAIHDYIAQNSQRYARITVDHITRRTQLLSQFPLSGWTVPEYEHDEVREVLEGSYRILYRALAARIDVLAVIHAARKLPRHL